MKIKFEWEEISQKKMFKNEYTCRAKTIGGWLVRFGHKNQISPMVFVPDPEHKWEIE